MARLPRVFLPGIPHHVTQRGNGRQQTFFEDGDYAFYLDLLAAAAERAQVQVWSCCLMPNHVHVILCPQDEDGLWRTFGDLHRRYTGFINARHRTTGHLWQGRFGSVAMDEALTYAALRKAESVGRPIGSPAWLKAMEEHTGTALVPQKRGPKANGFRNAGDGILA
ncbi:transposase [Novosphingobium sp. FKTRR1]|uniref:transposase n=1 Tax=Novosphingobium sp. FKTRR1 TaxID=2879118 RepID=UPI001CEFC606|nr:transposase [Novosphingobium sp. FKTRR1]